MASNGNGKPLQVCISTLVKTKWSSGDFYQTISKLLQSKPSGELTIFISQGGIIGVEFTERASQKKT